MDGCWVMLSKNGNITGCSAERTLRSRVSDDQAEIINDSFIYSVFPPVEMSAGVHSLLKISLSILTF